MKNFIPNMIRCPFCDKPLTLLDDDEYFKKLECEGCTWYEGAVSKYTVVVYFDDMSYMQRFIVNDYYVRSIYSTNKGTDTYTEIAILYEKIIEHAVEGQISRYGEMTEFTKVPLTVFDLKNIEETVFTIQFLLTFS